MTAKHEGGQSIAYPTHPDIGYDGRDGVEGVSGEKERRCGASSNSQRGIDLLHNTHLQSRKGCVLHLRHVKFGNDMQICLEGKFV